MSKYYEHYRSGKEGFMIRHGDLEYPPHFHQNIELCILLTGEQEISIGGEVVHAVAPCVVVIDNFTVHSYGSGEGKRCVIIIPHEMVTEFNRLRHGKILIDACIYNAVLAENIMYIINNYLQNASEYYQISSALNMIMSLIESVIALTEADNNREDDLINRILTYIHNNFNESISLKSAARSLGYAEGHLSRVFHKYIKESFPCYVNRLRFEYVQNHNESKENITQLIFDAGFRSIQTYYRTKKQLTKT